MFSANLKPKTNPFSYHRFRNDGTKRLLATTAKCSLKNKQDLIVKIKERMNGKVEISPSAYDMAWVAMVPERVHSGEKPHFPAALDWIVENQNPDGSWGLRSPSLLKDSLYCTLACLLALRKWNVSQQLVQKGVEFISSSASAARNDDEPGPIGFELVFPMMLHYAKELGLSLPLDQDLLDTLLQNRDSSLKRNKNLEYVGEGVGNSVEFFQKLLTWQRSNGSLFNSPATTAAALIRFHDDKCLQYLTSLLTEFKAWVPTIHPVDVYAHLCLVDCLQDLGVGRFFQPEIHAILHETFRLWEKKDEEICGDVKCHAMAFRLLRLDGYPVSSDELDEYIDEENFFNKVSIESSGVDTVFELYKASQVRLPEDEGTLDSLHHWTFNFLEEKLRSKAIQDRNLERKVEFKLKNYHGILEAIRYRRSIDLYDVDHIRLLKTAYRCPTVYNEDILLLAAQDFMTRHALNQKELQVLTRWYDETRLEKMDYGRHVIPISHFLNANTFPDPEQSEALLAFAKTMTLVTRLDDFFDHHGSREHSVLIIELIKQWDDPSTIDFPTEEVEILYSALHSTVTELAETAYPMQGRYITSTITHLWVELLTCFLSEMDSVTLEIPPNIEEYMEYAWISISCRLCILVAIHFVGEKISEELVMGPECFELSRHVGSIARLLNDIQTFEKERKERTLNSVIIQLNADKISEEEAVSNVEKMVEYHRKELLKMVVRREGSLVPKRCKDVFWRTGKVGYYLYDFKDEFTSPHKMKEDMKLLFHHPLNTTSLVH